VLLKLLLEIAVVPPGSAGEFVCLIGRDYAINKIPASIGELALLRLELSIESLQNWLEVFHIADFEISFETSQKYWESPQYETSNFKPRHYAIVMMWL
jgi:hypothetical protein